MALFDAELLNNLPSTLAPFQGLADHGCVTNALLQQIRCVSDVSSRLQSDGYTTSGEPAAHAGYRVRSLYMYLPQPVAAALYPSRLTANGYQQLLLRCSLPSHGRPGLPDRRSGKKRSHGSSRRISSSSILAGSHWDLTLLRLSPTAIFSGNYLTLPRCHCQGVSLQFASRSRVLTLPDSHSVFDISTPTLPHLWESLQPGSQSLRVKDSGHAVKPFISHPSCELKNLSHSNSHQSL